MVTRTRFDDSECPVARSVDAIGDWWSLLIVRDAFDGSRRFGEFQRGLGVAKNILTARLRTLVAGGVLETVPASDGSAYREYVLTGKGRALFPVVVALRQWGEQNSFAPGEPHSQLVDRRDGRPLRALEVRSADGRRLDPDDTTVRKVAGR
ncbi:winged helix-turn-helix transcriptional regulator [Actinacidiphila epipremni]|jgi:DNA-binding HxlR family transcriptional regulator|uniref:Helix-turn-helix transcriptional regulator n=1 Tax=Actinacidiphila epipremni TaxID=2053013 RepID=A0ABX0ZQ12_9ACTN|nr:helix-turn-helix domain-containing protein [Actinacidiphila epipremni]NJP44379.1 helix-turn-helix transcriptional regulator [Actinacidiphila epipremni]